MEFDSDCEIIEDTDDVTVSVATTGGQAKLVSKMDPGRMILRMYMYLLFPDYNQ